MADKDTIEVPVALAWEILALLTGVCAELYQLPYPTQGCRVRDEFSKLLEPWRGGGDDAI